MAVALAVVTLAGCGGDSGDGDEESAPTTRARPSSSSTAVAGTAPGGEAPTTVPVAGGAGSASGGATTGPKGAGRATPTTAAGRVRAPGGAALPSSSAPSATRPGRYRYASTGTFSFGAGTEQQRSGESILTVDPPAGADQHSVRQGTNRSTEQVLRFQPDGIYIVMLKVSDQGLTKEFRPSPPALAFPYGPAVGRTWSWRMTSTDGQTTVDANFRIERKESVRVGEESVPAVVVHATLTTRGDLASNGTQTLWVAETERLVVREEAVTNGTFGDISFHSTAREELLTLTPS